MYHYLYVIHKKHDMFCRFFQIWYGHMARNMSKMEAEEVFDASYKEMFIMKNNRFVSLVRNTLKIYSDNEMGVYSGYATLYILMALIPLFMLVISVVNLMPWFSAEDFSAFLFKLIPDLPQVQDMFTGIIRNLNSQSSGLIASISVLTTLWSASNGVSAIQAGLEHMDDQKASGLRGKPKALLFTLLFILLIPALLIFQLLREPFVAAVVSVLDYLKLARAAEIFVAVMNYSSIITIAAAAGVLVLTYTYLPMQKHTLKSQIPGAVFTLILSAVFTAAFSFFMGSFWKASAVYGSLAAIFLSTMWLKFILMILFFGAALNRAKEN